MDLKTYWAKGDGTTLAEHNEKLLEALEKMKKYGYIKNEKMYTLIKQACIMHDYGKVNEFFQNRVKNGGKFDSKREVVHNILSLFFINPKDFEENDYYRVVHAVGNHHNYEDIYQALEEKKDLILQLLSGLPIYELNRKQKSRLRKVVNDPEAILIKGYLHKCDYSASGDYQIEYPNDFLESSLEHLLKKWKDRNPKSEWNELQEFCKNRKEENIIAVAQTGMGKTEAGLHWIGNNKGYFILPLRTAINAIYDRVSNEIIEHKQEDSRIAILHSGAFEYYIDNVKNEEIDTYAYYMSGKNWSLPLNISTMDQLFDFIFMYQGYELKLASLAYAKIVIDEIQMYNPEMLAYLVAGLEKISEFGGKIAILTATLPPFIKDKLTRKITFKEENCGEFVNDLKRHNVKVLDKKINSQDIIEKYEENHNEGRSNKILVVCNTIKGAQILYQQLREKISNKENEKELYILHSRFTKKERRAKEKQILEFGKTYLNPESKEIDEQSGIWISTSLVEASLDIDFDYLFTELQELSSLFQRFGRCNRKGVKDISRPNCFVYAVIENKMLTKANGFIDSELYQLSKEAIKTVEDVVSEEMKIKLIEDYLTTERLKDSEYLIEYNTIYNMVTKIEPYQYEQQDQRLRNILSQAIIPNEVYEKNKTDIDEASKKIFQTKDRVEKVKAKEQILQYTVDVPLYEWLKYVKNVRRNLAIKFPTIKVGQGEIPVMECRYNELGFQGMEYEKEIREVKFV